MRAEVIGIDNDLSAGAVEVLLPYFKSKVQMHQFNLYDLTPETFGKFGIVIFPGVLYHLRSTPDLGTQAHPRCTQPARLAPARDGGLFGPSGIAAALLPDR